MSQLVTLVDEARELEIAWAAKNMEIAHLSMQTPGADYMHLAGERDHWKSVMETAIKARSPAKVAAMERAKGLAYA